MSEFAEQTVSVPVLQRSPMPRANATVDEDKAPSVSYVPSSLSNGEFVSAITTKFILDQGLAYSGKEVKLTGTVMRYKKQTQRAFGHIVDGSECKGLQFVHFFSDETSTDLKSFMDAVKVGSSVIISGTIVESPAKGQDTELLVESARTISTIDDPESYQYSAQMTKKKTPVEWDERMISIRPQTYERFKDTIIQAIMRIRSEIEMELYIFFRIHGFKKIASPIITDADCEGAGEMFSITSMDMDHPHKTPDGKVDFSKDFFGKHAKLTVSGQLDAEALAQSLHKVFTFGHTFRAENSNTSRHLAEFLMLEPEFVLTHDDLKERFSSLLDLEESMVKHIIQYLLTSITGQDDLTYLSLTISPTIITDLQKIIAQPFGRVTYTEVIDILLQAVKGGIKFDQSTIEWGMDLGSEHERYLCEKVFDKPVFVTHYPQDLKSFYMKADEGCPEGRRTCQAVDLLVPGIGELCGGSMREDDPDKLLEQMTKKGISHTDLKWYVDLRRNGGFPTGGFGLGFERLVRMVTGISSIRDVIPFPRYPGHV